MSAGTVLPTARAAGRRQRRGDRRLVALIDAVERAEEPDLVLHQEAAEVAAVVGPVRGVGHGRRRLRKLGAGDVRRLQPAALGRSRTRRRGTCCRPTWSGRSRRRPSAGRTPRSGRRSSPRLPERSRSSASCLQCRCSTPVVLRPSMMYWFSALVDPLIDGPIRVLRHARRQLGDAVEVARAPASWLNTSWPDADAAAVDVVSTTGEAPSTLTVSATPAIDIFRAA